MQERFNRRINFLVGGTFKPHRNNNVRSIPSRNIHGKRVTHSAVNERFPGKFLGLKKIGMPILARIASAIDPSLNTTSSPVKKSVATISKGIWVCLRGISRKYSRKIFSILFPRISPNHSLYRKILGRNIFAISKYLISRNSSL